MGGKVRKSEERESMGRVEEERKVERLEEERETIGEEDNTRGERKGCR